MRAWTRIAIKDDEKTEYNDAPDDRAIQAEPEAWDSGSEWEKGEPNEDLNAEDPEVEESLKMRSGMCSMNLRLPYPLPSVRG